MHTVTDKYLTPGTWYEGWLYMPPAYTEVICTSQNGDIWKASIDSSGQWSHSSCSGVFAWQVLSTPIDYFWER